MWTISDEQFVKIKASLQEEYMLRVCKFVSADEEFAWMLPQAVREKAEKVLDKRMRYIFKDEKYAAEIVKRHIEYPTVIAVPYNREVDIILNKSSGAQYKLQEIDDYIKDIL